jgi:hypothetical protein
MFFYISDNPVVSLGRDSGNAVQSFMKFANETSLHGWKYVQTSSPLERFCWLVLLIVALITGKSLSEALIFASTNPQYDNRLFIALQVHYMKITSSNLGRTCCVQKLFLTFRTIFVHKMFSPCSAKKKNF